MAVVQEILEALDSKVSTILPDYKKSKFNYFLDRNNRLSSKKIYAIRPDTGKSTVGTTLSATFDQNFEVILSDIYQDKNDSDADLTAKIISLHSDVEKLYLELYQRRLDLPSAMVLVVQLVDLSSPELDTDNNTVNIVGTFSIKYRSQLGV